MGGIRGNIEFEYNLVVGQGNARRLRTLIKHGAKPQNGIMLFALVRGHPELLPLLKEAGADPNSPDGFGETALGYAVECCDSGTVQQVLELGANPEIESLMMKPLIHAALFGKSDTVRVLLNFGANPNAPQPSGLTALLEAVRYGYADIVRMLMEHGADPKFRGPDGADAIQLANREKHRELIPLLKPSILKSAVQRNSTRGRRR